jgi:HD-GYP domain-containing protein (c-di-GMP phosphodiesterase class II)
LEVLKDTLTEDDYRIVFEHPNIAAKTIAGMNEIPPDVEMMIRQHHELPNQTGFPSKCGFQKITAFSAVFIVAHNLADYILENPKWSMEEFIVKYKSRLHGSHFSKIMRALPEMK